MNNLRKLFVLFFLSFLLSFPVFSQNSVGVNTLTPNPNSVLELISPQNNQGLLIPRMTTVQRSATEFTSKLNFNDIGLLVYDTDFNTLYWWIGDSWHTVEGVNIAGGEGINVVGNTVINTAPDKEVTFTNTGNVTITGTYPNFTVSSSSSADDDPENELQNLTIASDKLSLSGSTITVDLTPYLDNTDKQNISLSGNAVSIDDGTGFDLASNAPALNNVLKWDGSKWTADVDNGQVYTAGANINIAAGVISASIDDADADATNEIQDLSWNGNEIQISSTGANINLSGIAPADGQILTWINANNRWEATNAGVNTDAQAISLAANILSITGNAGTVDLSGISITESQISDLTHFTNADETDQVFTASPAGIIVPGDITNWNTAHGWGDHSSAGYLTSFTEVDGSVTNEIQDLDLTGDILKITNNGSASNIDLAPYKNSINWGANQNLIEINNGGNILLSSVAPVNGDVLKWVTDHWQAQVDTDNDDQLITIAGNTVGISGVSASSFELSSTVPGGADGGKVLEWDGSKWDLGIDDNDDDQLISISGNKVSISGLSASSFDLSTNNPGNNEVLKWDGASWNAATDEDNQAISWDGADANKINLVDGGSINLSANSPANNQVLKWNGAKWDAANEVEYTAGDGITIGGGNKINSLWSAPSANEVKLTVDASDVAIGGNVQAGYKLYVNGRFQSAGVNELSDERWKENVITLDGSLDKVLNLRGVNYTWKTEEFKDKNFPEGKQFGFIAQEVEKVIPEAVNTNADGYKSVQYSHMVAFLVEAVKEQQKLIESQQKEIELLKAESANASISTKKIESMEAKISSLQENMMLLMKLSGNVDINSSNK